MTSVRSILHLSLPASAHLLSLAVNEYAPTFPPTSIDYYCYPWKGLDGSEAPKDNLDTNALSYLMMSNFEEPPAGGSIEYTGPWVDDGDRQGTFVMNRTLFWPWMHRLLRQMVIAMTPYPDTPYVKWSGENPDLPWSSNIQFHAGDDDAQDDEYQFNESWNPSDPGCRWALTGPCRQSDASATNPDDSDNQMVISEYSPFSPLSLIPRITGNSLTVDLYSEGYRS